MASYGVEIRDSDDIRVEVRNNPKALDVARAIAIAVAKHRVGEIVDVTSNGRRRLSFKAHEIKSVKVRKA